MQFQKKTTPNFMAIFAFVMVFFYIGLGLFIYFSDQFKYMDYWGGNVRLGGMLFLIAYGAFRGVRYYSKYYSKTGYDSES